MSTKAEKQPLTCPVCGAPIVKVTNSTLVKCSKNIYEHGESTGCGFLVDLKPKILKGQQITRDQFAAMLEGEAVEFKVGIGRIDPSRSTGYYFSVEFPENEMF